MMDIVENLSMLINSSKKHRKSFLVGAVNATCKLLNSPEIKMGFNDKLFNKKHEEVKLWSSIPLNFIIASLPMEN